MKRWTLGSGMLVTSSILCGGFVVAGGLSYRSTPEGQIPQDVENLYRDLLEQAQTEAQQGRLPQAVNAIAGIPHNSRHALTSEQLRERWSKDLLRLARNHYAQGQLKEALALLKVIPESTSEFEQAKNLQASWLSQSKQLEQADAAYSNRNWAQTLQLLEPLRNTELYSSPRIQAMLQQSIDAAFNSRTAATDLSTADQPLPAQLSAEAPDASQPEAETAPALSPIVMNVDEAMARSTPPVEIASANESNTASVSIDKTTSATAGSPRSSSESTESPAIAAPTLISPAESSLNPDAPPQPTAPSEVSPSPAEPESITPAPENQPEPPVVPSQPEIRKVTCQPSFTAQALPEFSSGVVSLPSHPQLRFSHDRKQALLASADSEIRSDLAQHLISTDDLRSKATQPKAECL